MCAYLRCSELRSLKVKYFVGGMMHPRIFVVLIICLAFISGCAPEGTSSSSPDKSAAPAAPATSSVPSSFDLGAGDMSLKSPAGIQNADSIVSNGKEGALVAGPSTVIQAGKYVARWYGTWGTSSDSRPVVFDVYWNGLGPWPSTNPKPGQQLSAKDNILAEVPFEIPSPASNFQTRVWVSAGHKLTITRIELRPR
jgi:hypothetical protein